MESENNGGALHLAMFPFFAFGHISPFEQLSNKLSSHAGVRISFLTAAGNVHRIKSMLNLTTTVQIIPLSLPTVPGLPPGIESTADTDPATSELLKVALDLMQPQIKTLLSQLNPHFVLFDFAHGWLPPLASQLGIKTILFSVFTAISTSFATVPARLPDDKTAPTVEQAKLPPSGFPKTSVTSLKTFEALDLLYIFMSFHGTPSVYNRLLAGLKNSSAILIKTCNEMEKLYVDYIKSQFNNKPVLLAGPVVPEPRSGELDQRWGNWLDQFPSKSVIYCSFGSETFLNDDQITELVLGLELTGLPFFVVLNFPVGVDISDEINRVLPEGFLERVKGKGVVHSGWVQQQHILGHDSVGYYVCHAGFSSVIEAIVNDCQVVMLPLKGDQFANSKLVSLDLKAGVEINRRDEDGYFGKEDVCEAVKTLMVEVESEPGKSIRANQKKWSEFLLNNEIHTDYITNLVKELKAMAHHSE
ncbi:hypothetical protein LguiB_030866 [Lonicera macranthoides]